MCVVRLYVVHGRREVCIDLFDCIILSMDELFINLLNYVGLLNTQTVAYVFIKQLGSIIKKMPHKRGLGL